MITFILKTVISSLPFIVPPANAAGASLITAGEVDLTDPQIIYQCSYKVVLVPGIREALRNYAPDFRIWEQSEYNPEVTGLYSFSARQSPSAIKGDFNGDGYMDAALSGRNKTSSVLLAVLSDSATSYKVIEIHQPWFDKTKIDFATPILSVQPKGSRYTYGDMEVRTLALENEAIGIQYLGRDRLSGTLWLGEIYYWAESKKTFLNQWFEAPG